LALAWLSPFQAWDFISFWTLQEDMELCVMLHGELMPIVGVVEVKVPHMTADQQLRTYVYASYVYSVVF
jgi:hypothetical protein